MADIAATDITITLNRVKKLEDGRKIVNAKMVFGDGALTYPAGGVPISKAKLGCPTVISSLTVIGKGTSGYEWSYDTLNEKLVAMQSAAVSAHTHTGPSHTHTGPAHTHTADHTHDQLYIGGITATEAVAIQGGDTLGKNAATNRTIVGADSATKGGVVATSGLTTSSDGTGATGASGTGATSSDGAVSAAGLSQPSTVAIAAQTLYVEVIGY